MGHETSGARKWVPARALARLAGTTELVVRMFVSMHALTYSIVKQPIAMSEIAWSQRRSAPVYLLWARGSPSFLSLRFPSGEGVGAPTRRIARIAPGGVRITPDDGRETSRPAPCGAPTRHLGLYAFDRGRTGPAPSDRRGCRVRPGDEGCVRPSLAGAAPVPRLQNASGRRPSKSGSG